MNGPVPKYAKSELKALNEFRAKLKEEAATDEVMCLSFNNKLSCPDHVGVFLQI